MAAKQIQSVFLNIPYDKGFEDLYVAYIVGLTQLGLQPRATLAVANQGRLEAIIRLIEESDASIHDLSRVEVSDGIPRFNMPLELGLALYCSHISKEAHRVYVFESQQYRAQRSTSDINGLDPHIHKGRVKELMSELRSVFRPEGNATTVPEMLASFSAVKRRLPKLRRDAGGGSLFKAAVFRDLCLVALIESQKLIERRQSRPRKR